MFYSEKKADLCLWNKKFAHSSVMPGYYIGMMNAGFKGPIVHFSFGPHEAVKSALLAQHKQFDKSKSLAARLHSGNKPKS